MDFNAGAPNAGAPNPGVLPDTALVDPVHNALAHVQRCLQSLVETSPHLPLIVVDDASDAPTHQWLRAFLAARPSGEEGLRVLRRNERQQLFTRSVNRGLRRAYQMRCAEDPLPIDFVAVVNSDCLLHANWLTALRMGMEDPRVGLVGYCDRADGEEPAFRELREPQYVGGHCFLVRMAMLEEIGVLCETDTTGVDVPDLAPYLGQAHVGSDRLLSWRANRAGWKTLECHGLFCDHAGGASWHHDLDWLARGLAGCRPEDVVLVSDVDEIPRASCVQEQCRTPGVKVFQQRFSYYFLNNVCEEPWQGTRMLSYADFRRLGDAQAVRGASGLPVPEGGWHFSFMGGAGSIRGKLQAYAYQEYNTPPFTDPGHLNRVLAANADLFGRELQWQIVPEDGLPRYVRDHRARFSDWIYDGPLFHEGWYDDDLCRQIVEAYRRVEELPGDVVEIGCCKGRSTVALANACYPAPLFAVDTWEGNVSEDPDDERQLFFPSVLPHLGILLVVVASPLSLQYLSADCQQPTAIFY